MGVLAPLGKEENLCLLWWPDWDMSLVFITHIGFVTMVLLAPAIMDDQKFITKVFSVEQSLNQPDTNLKDKEGNLP